MLDHESGAARRSIELGARVVIFDVVGHIEAIGLGELLARRGVEVDRGDAVRDADAASIARPPATPCRAPPRPACAGGPTPALVAIGDARVTLLDVFSRRTETVADVDRVVIRTHGVADDALYFALLGRVPEVVRVGDAVAVRWADRAIFDGHMAGRAV